jgi:hypothetical protein
MSNQTQHVAVWKSGSYLKWRGISIREYAIYSRRLDFEPEMTVYCDLYNLVTDPEDRTSIEDVTAGIVYFLGRTLLLESAFSGNINRVKQVLGTKRAQLAENYIESCKAVLAAMFKYTFEEIESWDESTFFDRLAKAELISNENLDPHLLEEDTVGTNDKPKPPERRPKKELTSTQKMALDRTMGL